MGDQLVPRLVEVSEPTTQGELMTSWESDQLIVLGERESRSQGEGCGSEYSRRARCGKPHAGICAGLSGNWQSYRDQLFLDHNHRSAQFLPTVARRGVVPQIDSSIYAPSGRQGIASAGFVNMPHHHLSLTVFYSAPERTCAIDSF